MIEGPAAETDRRADLKPRQAGELIPPVARPRGTVAVYDTVTEGLTGWQFLRTWRWFGYIASAIIFAIVCVLLSNWQFGRGQQTSADNNIIAANFSATPVPIEKALPTLDTYDASQNWQRVVITGVYRANEELIVRNRSNSGTNGFEVLTPLQLSNGSTFMVDRGWVAPSPADVLVPDSVPRPASGSVKVLVQLRPSEPPRGTVTPAGNEIGSIALSAVRQKIVGALYTGAYGVFDSQSPAEPGLKPIQTTMPIKDAGTNYSYALQWLLFALIGFIALGRGMRQEYRRLNADDPAERARASERLRKRARKPFADEELEDERLDGYIPLTRWGISGGTMSRPALAPRAPSPGTQDTLANEKAEEAREFSVPPTVFLIQGGHQPGDNEP